MNKDNNGFTLVELLVSIAVIGILTSMLVPAINKFMEEGRKTKGSNALSQIAKAYLQYININKESSTIDKADKVSDWALVLAKAGYLNDPRMYIFPDDIGASKVQSKVICKPPNGAPDSAFAKATAFSVTVAMGVPSSSDPSITPLAWTRGLQSNGKWSTSGVYGSKGGFIAFLDGHVEWFSDLGTDTTDGKLVKSSDGTATNNISEALNGGTSIPSL
ncbi:MAG: prepilin-type N-terminal cleavage/methylation domain-containing protein [Puniceicoccales bacterium]|jgi:prepilin-type N-terminal cleavage/methylation domain-containing protein/prepilin-type processing-associated H-X9-DG protein|nr:prepilin-type N-terminal cleavage/methylation domain-containing protein [Puniceicoccales bacterium]